MYPWGHSRRFNAYSNYFRELFGERVQKLSIDAGFTCPNRDGSRGRGGCTYCDNNAFNPSYCHPGKPVSQQIIEGIEFHERRYRRASKYLAYFQAYSNTYAPLDELKQIYSQALEFKQVVGIVIGTRPDCIDEEKLSYFSEISKTHYVIIEYGLESCYDRSLELINRKHTFAESVRALELTVSYGLKTGAHMIIGLPGESREEMLEQSKILSGLPINNIKFHQLQIIKNTKMASDFQKNPEKYTFFELQEYVEFIIDFVERLNPSFVIERFAGEVPPPFLAGPGWGMIRNDQILAQIEKRLKQRNTWQGKSYDDLPSKKDI